MNEELSSLEERKELLEEIADGLIAENPTGRQIYSEALKHGFSEEEARNEVIRMFLGSYYIKHKELKGESVEPFVKTGWGMSISPDDWTFPGLTKEEG